MRQHILALIERHLGRGHFSGESNISLRCPFHKGGEETKPSFSVNVDLGIFRCFTCKVSGGMQKLLRLLGLPSQVVDAELHDIRDEIEDNKKRLHWKKRAAWAVKDPFLAPTILPEVTLKPYEWCPSKLVECGFDAKWLEYVGVGFDRGNNRITYPIRDLYGNLAGISGGSTFAGQYPKYKVYQGRRKDPQTGRMIPSDYGIWFDEKYPNYEFHNHNYLWNFDQVYPGMFFGKEQNLIIVEGFKACIWLLQNGFSNTVALMGSSMSDHQCNLLRRLDTNIVLFLDQDDAGRKGTKDIGKSLRKTQGVFIAKYPYVDNCQPDNLNAAELATSIQEALSYPVWLKGERV